MTEKEITYDTIGNRTSYDGYTYVWESGRQLKRMTKDGSFNCGQNFVRNLGIVEDGVASTLNAQGPSAVAWDGDSAS